MTLPAMRHANSAAQAIISVRLMYVGCKFEEYVVTLDEKEPNEKEPNEKESDEEESDEEEDNSTTVSECACTDLDGTRPPKRARTDVDLDVDSTRASKRSFTGPSATASETSTLVSGLNTMQLNNELRPDSEIEHALTEPSHCSQNVASQASVEVQGGDLGDINGTSDENSQGLYHRYDFDTYDFGVDSRFVYPTREVLFGDIDVDTLISDINTCTQDQLVTPFLGGA